MSNANWFSTLIWLVLKAIIIGISCFFLGLLLITLSPLIATISLFHKPEKKKPLSDRWATNLKKVEDKLKEIRDPDSGENWKKRHHELYGNTDDTTNSEA